jgi:hypothetical protein
MVDRSRRVFTYHAPGLALLVLAARGRAAPPELSEDDPKARALGYVGDAKRTDRAKFPQYDEAQNCANCQLFEPQPGSVGGACSLFDARLVRAAGWCSGYRAAM